MKRIIQTVIALTVLLLVIPFTSNTASAADFSDIENGNHNIKVKLLTKGTNDESIANDYIKEDAKLNIKNGEKELVLTIPIIDGFEFSEFKVEGNGFTKNTDAENAYYTFKLNDVKPKLNSVVTYKVTKPFTFEHKNVEMDIELLGLDKLPKVEKPEPAEDVRKTGTLLTEAEADAVYKVNFESDSPATNRQLENPTKIIEKDGKQYVQIGVNEGGAPLFRSLQFNGTEVTWNSITEGPYTIQFALPSGVDSKIDVSMVIQAGPNVMPHDDINLWFDKNSLEVIKETEEKPEEKPEPAEDVRKTGTLLTEAEADAVYQVNFDSDSNATKGQLVNPAKILEKDGKQYVQIGVNERGAPLFRSLQFNGTEVTWNSITEGPYTIQFALPNGVDSKIDVSMVIQAGPRVMPHDGIKLWFDKDSLEVVKEKPEPKPDPTPTAVEVEVGKTTPTPIKPMQTIQISDTTGKDTGSTIVTPADLPEDVSIIVKKVEETDKKVKDAAHLEIAGDIYTIELENFDHKEIDGKFTLTLKYDKYEEGTPAIYYYNEATNEWEIRPGGTVDKATKTISLEVEHFSTYGVFVTKADEEESTLEDSKEDPKEDPKENPEKKDPKKYNNLRSFKATILKEDKSDKSVANEFFLDGGFLYELQGKTYAELTIRNADMVKDLKSQFGKAKTLREFEKDGILYRVVRLPVDENLKDTLLTMTIHVPGLYESTYDTYLTMSNVIEIKDEDKNDIEKKNIEESEENPPSIVDEINNNNDDNNHSNVEKPAFDDNDDDKGNGGKKVNPHNNPQTGDTTMIAFYTVLLIGSLLVLFFQYKRRFVN